MNLYLFAASLGITIVALIHSFLGEKLIVKPILKLNLPKILGSELLTKQTVRFAWHLTTLAAFGFAAILFFYSLNPIASDVIVITIKIIATGLFVAALISAVATQGRHFSWWAFLLIGILTWLGNPSSH